MGSVITIVVLTGVLTPHETSKRVFGDYTNWFDTQHTTCTQENGMLKLCVSTKLLLTGPSLLNISVRAVEIHIFIHMCQDRKENKNVGTTGFVQLYIISQHLCRIFQNHDFSTKQHRWYKHR